MKRMSLTAMLVTGGIGIMLVTALSVGGIGMVKSARGMETLFINQVGATAKSLSDMIQLSLTQEMNMLKELALDPSAVRAAARVEKEGTQGAAAEIELIQSKLAQVKSAIGQNYELIVVGDSSGKVFADSEKGTLKGIDMSDRGYFKLVREGKYNIGEVVRSKSSNAPILPIAAPIFSGENKVIGMLVIVLKIDYLLDTVTRAKIGETGYAYIVARDGVMLAHPDRSLILKANIYATQGMESIAKSISAGKPGAESYVYQGDKKIAGYVQAELTGWTVVVTQAYSDILAPIRSDAGGDRADGEPAHGGPGSHRPFSSAGESPGPLRWLPRDCLRRQTRLCRHPSRFPRRARNSPRVLPNRRPRSRKHLHPWRRCRP